MASGPLYFRTPHIEEIPIAQTKQAPGFAWVAVAKDLDPAKKQLEISGKKRARNAGLGPTDAQKEALSARQQRELERRLRELNTDGSKDANIPIPKRPATSNKEGKTTSTKKILASGKEFKHYLDDEEAELARTGKVDGTDRNDGTQRANKLPPARKDQSMTGTPLSDMASRPQVQASEQGPDLNDTARGLSEEEIADLLDAPPLTYNGATKTLSYTPSAPPRTFCDICGYWGLSKCLKCGARTCSIECESIHVADRCLKFYS